MEEEGWLRVFFSGGSFGIKTFSGLQQNQEVWVAFGDKHGPHGKENLKLLALYSVLVHGVPLVDYDHAGSSFLADQLR